MKRSSFFKSIFLPAFLFTAILPVFTQNRDFIPRVSQIDFELRGNMVKLTWVDSPDARGDVYIYRSARPFGGSVPANITPIRVRYGVQSHTEERDDMENIYFFIAASDINSDHYISIIPYQNYISIDPDFNNSILINDDQFLQGIYNLKAVQEGSAVSISFNISEPKKNVVLYRSANPVRSPQDIFGSVLLETGIFTQYTDYPFPGSRVYYAVIFEDEISSGNINIIPGLNSTTSAVYREGSSGNFMESIPLPVLSVGYELPGGFLPDVTAEIPLSADAINILYDYQLLSSPLDKKIPRVYKVDIEEPESGEESALFWIVNEFFIKSDWETAYYQLRRYLSVPRSREVEERARFYLGQTLYYMGQYNDALWEFLYYRSINQVEAAAWIDAILEELVNSN